MAEKTGKGLVSIGGKISAARKDKDVSLDFLANETGFSIQFLKEVESGSKMPSVGTILQISRALDIDSAVLLKEQESHLTNRISASTKRTENYAYKTLTSGGEKKYLKAFQVTIDARKEHSGVGYQHEGEEFVYVLQGKIELWVGENLNVLENGDSLHFNSGIKHKMKNLSDNDALLLVVLYAP